jgi:A/G-specific adenine glycosylase
VAEIMAQQTRISCVIPYYDSFLERFPDVETLAAAELDDVLKAWEGLGYYRRARNLHRAAREVLATHDGRLPDDPDSLRSLPGVGAYTTGAIASIAFGHPEPAVDGNVRRVLSRLFDIERPTPSGLDRRTRDLIAQAGGEAATVNQALMDLGASVCTPRAPGCETCPVSDSCLALQRGTVSARPPRRSRPPLPHHEIAAAIVWSGPRLLIARRPREGLLGGLWEFPGGKVEPGEVPAAAAQREVREETGLEIRITGAADRVRHAYSHIRVTLHLFHARLLGGSSMTGGSAEKRGSDSPRWVVPDELPLYAFPAANQPIVRRLSMREERAPDA